MEKRSIGAKLFEIQAAGSVQTWAYALAGVGRIGAMVLGSFAHPTSLVSQSFQGPSGYVSKTVYFVRLILPLPVMGFQFFLCLS